MIFGKVLLRIFLLVLIFFYACEGAASPCSKCGKKADCKIVRKNVPQCSCPLGTKGDPFVECSPVTDDDLCKDDTCGLNAECSPGKNDDGVKVPVCSCPAGYTGDPFEECAEE